MKTTNQPLILPAPRKEKNGVFFDPYNWKCNTDNGRKNSADSRRKTKFKPRTIADVIAERENGER